jgi:hypothetical protein
MGRIDLGRVVRGGLLAGLIFNIGEYLVYDVVLAEDVMQSMAAMNLPPVGGAAIVGLLTAGFAVGIATIWLYAAIRPRFGAGMRTALCAGSLVWFLAYLYPSITMWMLGYFPAGLTGITVITGLAELLVAAVAGAWLYAEAIPARS